MSSHELPLVSRACPTDLGERSSGVGKHANLPGGPLLVPPSRHHKRIVDGHAGNYIHALGFDGVVVLDVAGEMGLGGGTKQWLIDHQGILVK